LPALYGLVREALFVPVLDEASAFLTDQVCLASHQGAGILQQRRVVGLEDSQDMLSVRQTLVEQAALQIQGITQDGIKETPVAHQKTLQQSPGSYDLGLPGLQHLHIQHHGDVIANQVGHNTLMVTLNDLLLAHRNQALAAQTAAVMPAGEKTRDRPEPRTAVPSGWPAPCFASTGG